MNLPPKPPGKPPRPKPPLDEVLRTFIDEQRALDIKDSIDRIYDLFLRHDAEDKDRHLELRGDIRGLSLRVGAVEQKAADLAARTGSLEDRNKRLEDGQDDSQRWIIQDLDKRRGKAEEHATWLRRNAFAIAASIVAIASTLWHLFR